MTNVITRLSITPFGKQFPDPRLCFPPHDTPRHHLTPLHHTTLLTTEEEEKEHDYVPTDDHTRFPRTIHVQVIHEPLLSVVTPRNESNLAVMNLIPSIFLITLGDGTL